MGSLWRHGAHAAELRVSYTDVKKRRQFKVQRGDVPGGPVAETLPSNAGGAGLIPRRGPKIPHTSWPKNQNTEQKQYCNKLNKGFKNGPHQK